MTVSGYQLGLAATLLVAFAIALISRTTGRRKWFGILRGTDGRYSTSITIATAWTAVIAWGFLSLLFIRPATWTASLANFNSVYLAFLGGPYVSLILAKTAVSAKVTNKTLQKTHTTSASLADIISNDAGNTDLVDVQYVLFNAIAIAYVIESLLSQPGPVFPLLPPELVALTGGPAAIYVANKALGTNKATIFSVSPSPVAFGGTFTISGENFLAGAKAGDESATVIVRVGGIPATVISHADCLIEATAPHVPSSMTMPATVTLITPSGAQALLPSAITVLPTQSRVP